MPEIITECLQNVSGYLERIDTECQKIEMTDTLLGQVSTSRCACISIYAPANRRPFAEFETNNKGTIFENGMKFIVDKTNKGNRHKVKKYFNLDVLPHLVC